MRYLLSLLAAFTLLLDAASASSRTAGAHPTYLVRINLDQWDCPAQVGSESGVRYFGAPCQRQSYGCWWCWTEPEDDGYPMRNMTVLSGDGLCPHVNQQGVQIDGHPCAFALQFDFVAYDPCDAAHCGILGECTTKCCPGGASMEYYGPLPTTSGWVQTSERYLACGTTNEFVDWKVTCTFLAYTEVQKNPAYILSCLNCED